MQEKNGSPTDGIGYNLGKTVQIDDAIDVDEENLTTDGSLQRKSKRKATEVWNDAIEFYEKCVRKVKCNYFHQVLSLGKRELTNKKRVPDDADESLEVKRLKEDFLNDLNDPNQWRATEDLNSFMKSFEAKINGFPWCVNFENLTSDSNESQLDLVDLFEASNDHR
ncbi:unnamed protein product [Ilex paraguariensis]|uniref:Uncharacterized protein n=1 Tax=Ilex paraguariensis TaxID=185542 RepID=A0ABC8UJZ1_9AQUA